MTVAEVKKVLDGLPDEYDIPVLTWLFKENNPYLVSDDFYHFMKKLDERDMDIVDIYDQLALLGDSQEELGNGHLVSNLWKLIEFLQKAELE